MIGLDTDVWIRYLAQDADFWADVDNWSPS
ncbi:putative nucleic-acid-binding protein [Caballeronia udeis]|uniref:Nucleic-acid-binding protein n=1 Tax=Caballeronia udeis TaxID=1232866 RepID=A0ABW8MHK9_9BURK